MYSILICVILVLLKVLNALNWDWIWIMSPLLIQLSLETILDMVSRFLKSTRPESFLDKLIKSNKETKPLNDANISTNKR